MADKDFVWINGICHIRKEGLTDEWCIRLQVGWYFAGEDDGATMYGPYATKELCENALIRFVDDLNKGKENATS